MLTTFSFASAGGDELNLILVQLSAAYPGDRTQMINTIYLNYCNLHKQLFRAGRFPNTHLNAKLQPL